MKRFLIFVRKEMLQILRDWRTMLIIILMPIVQIILFGFAISTEVNNVDVAIVAPHYSETVRQMAERLDANSYTSLRPGLLTSTDEAEALMRKGEIHIAVVVDPQIDRILAGSTVSRCPIELLCDASNPVISRTSATYVSSIIQQCFPSAEAPFSVDTHMLYNPQLQSSYIFVPGILGLIILIICTMITASSIVKEMETGTMDLLLVSPVRSTVMIGAKMVPYFLLSCLNLASILLLSKFLLQVPMQGSLLSIVGVSLLYTVLSLSLGILISTVAKTQAQAIIVSGVVLLMPVMMLSGLMFPIESIPTILQYASTIVPARWYIEAMRKLMIEGLPIQEVLTQTGILAGMTVTFLSLALFNLNKKL